MWHKLVAGASPASRFGPPATPSHIRHAEELLGLRLPEGLSTLLIECDGIEEEYRTALVWPLMTIVQTNLEFRGNADFADLYMPFDPLLFFANAANGDQFAFRILRGTIRTDDVYLWEHETDSRSWVAPSLEVYLEWRLSGKIDG